MTDIIIIEDDPEFGQLLLSFITKEGFSAELCASAEKALEVFSEKSFRLVLLDVMLPGMDGFATCSVLRKKSNIPILMMSAQNGESEKLLGYESGADDYIDKPFSIRVLTAKLKALLKRNSDAEKTEGKLSACDVEIDLVSRKVIAYGRECQLNLKEFELLRYLMENKGRAICRDEIFDKVWGDNCFTEPSTVSVHIRWLREKIEIDPNAPQLIQTVRKVGYKFGGGQ